MPKITLTEARVRALRPGKTVRDIPRSVQPIRVFWLRLVLIT